MSQQPYVQSVTANSAAWTAVRAVTSSPATVLTTVPVPSWEPVAATLDALTGTISYPKDGIPYRMVATRSEGSIVLSRHEVEGWDPLEGLIQRAVSTVEQEETSARNTASRKVNKVKAARARLAKAEARLAELREVEADWDEETREVALQFIRDGMPIRDAVLCAWRVM